MTIPTGLWVSSPNSPSTNEGYTVTPWASQPSDRWDLPLFLTRPKRRQQGSNAGRARAWKELDLGEEKVEKRIHVRQPDFFRETDLENRCVLACFTKVV